MRTNRCAGSTASALRLVIFERDGVLVKIRSTLSLTGLHDRFADRIFSADEVGRGKPAPELFLYAAGQMGVTPEVCAVIEDSAMGVAAGRAAGMHVYAYAGGVTPADRLVGANTTVFHHMRELPGLLDAFGAKCGNRTPRG